MKLFFSVGEPSGDLHGANLIKALKAKAPQLEFVGYGGPKMKAAGCHLHVELTEYAIMGFIRVLLYLHKFYWFMLKADRYFKEHQPDAVILIDFPGFNWWIAARAKARGIPVYYYGTPQLWAWLPGRVKKMQRYVDHVLCKLPFEEKWYRDRNCNAHFVGHPYYDELQNQKLDQQFINELNQRSGPLVTILPGSRTQEVKSNTSSFLQTAKKILAKHPNTRFAIAAFKQSQVPIIQQQLDEEALDFPIYVNRTPELINSAYCCLACSGSVSLELLYHEKPSVIHYRVGKFDDYLQRKFRRVKYITLVNILWSQDPFYQEGEFFLYDPDNQQHENLPFPEYLTAEDKSDAMAGWISQWIDSEDEHQKRVDMLVKLKQKVSGSGASEKGATYILEHLGLSRSNEAHDQLAKAS